MVRALNGVTLAVERGETLAVVGEFGSGKSTLARTLVRLIEADSGQTLFDGEDVRAFRGEALRRYNRRVQMVFQDPDGLLNPRMTVGEMLGEALRVHGPASGARSDARIADVLDLVRLPADASRRLPHEFSGGQRQRIAIARALSVEPQLLIADEIVSSLDVSVQAQILNLLLDLQEQLALADPVRLARSACGASYRAPHRDHVSRPRGGVGSRQKRLRCTASSLARKHCCARPPPWSRRRKVCARPSAGEAALIGELPSPLAIPSGCPFHDWPTAFRVFLSSLQNSGRSFSALGAVHQCSTLARPPV